MFESSRLYPTAFCGCRDRPAYLIVPIPYQIGLAVVGPQRYPPARPLLSGDLGLKVDEGGIEPPSWATRATLARSPLVTDPDSDRGGGGGSRGPGGLEPPTPADQREKESAPAA